MAGKTRDIDWNKVTGIAALITAICALFVSVWQGFETRVHNRLSVRPIVLVKLIDVKSEAPGVFIKNVGIGPAVIKSVKVYIDNKPLPQPTSAFLPEIVVNSLPGLPPSTEWEVTGLAPGFVLQPGEEVPLFKYRGNKDYDVVRARLSNSFTRFNMEIAYQSIYGELYDTEKEAGLTGKSIVNEVKPSKLQGTWKGIYIDQAVVHESTYEFNNDGSCRETIVGHGEKGQTGYIGHYSYDNGVLKIQWDDGETEYGSVQWISDREYKYTIISASDKGENGFEIRCKRVD